MSDDLSPAEQARAARWAADWLTSEAYVGGTAIVELREYADTLDPPETVESLREQVDAEHAAWLSAENALHEANETVESLQDDCEELAVRLGFERAETARLRSTHAENVDALNEAVKEYRAMFKAEKAAHELAIAARNQSMIELTRMRSTHAEAEAAWERCKRQPRVWKDGEPEPLDLAALVDVNGRVWTRTPGITLWHTEGGAYSGWTPLIRTGPLTEVLS